MALDVFPIECINCDQKIGITRADLQPGKRLPCPACNHIGKTLDVDTIEGLRTAWDQLDAADEVLPGPDDAST